MTFKMGSSRFRDTGCTLHPSCLQCPREVCKYDDPQYSARGLNNDRRNEYIRRLKSQGVPLDVIADRLKLSKRSVHRVVSGR